MGKYVDDLKEKAKMLTKSEVIKGLGFVANYFLPIPDDTYSAVYRAIDIIQSIDEKLIACRADEQSGKATMYHKSFVDELKAQLAAKNSEIEVLRRQRDQYRNAAAEAEALKKKIGALLK